VDLDAGHPAGFEEERWLMKGIRSLFQVIRPLLVLACLGLQGCFGALAGLGGGMSQELRQNGVSAPARILEIWDTGWTINGSPVIGMKVRVQPSDRPAFEATIKKTTISRIATPQFQPGNVIPVRFDPKDPTVVAVDFDGPARSTPSSGNAYHDRFVRLSPLGAVFLPPPAAPQLYLGTADSAADTLALFENDYSLLGGSNVENGSNPQLALDQGKQVGAALVVVYGHFDPPPGLTLDVLPFHRRPPDPGQPVTNVPADARAMMLVSGLGPDDQFAAYWGKTRPAILGIVSRPLNDQEQARLRRKEGIVVEGVANGSPAAAAHIVAGDVIVAIDGKPLVDALAVPALITSLAGQKVRIDLIRNGTSLSVTAQLNTASP
jgi:PDZ domain